MLKVESQTTPPCCRVSPGWLLQCSSLTRPSQLFKVKHWIRKWTFQIRIKIIFVKLASYFQKVNPTCPEIVHKLKIMCSVNTCVDDSLLYGSIETQLKISNINIQILELRKSLLENTDDWMLAFTLVFRFGSACGVFYISCAAITVIINCDGYW